MVVTTYAPALRRDGTTLLERKTVDGLRRLARETGMAIRLVAREWVAALPMPLDPVAIADDDPETRIFVRKLGRRPDRAAKAAIAEALQGAAVVYGMGVDVLEAGMRQGVPIVPIVENLLANALRIERQQSRNWWDSFRRQLSSVLEFQRQAVAALEGRGGMEPSGAHNLGTLEMVLAAIRAADEGVVVAL